MSNALNHSNDPLVSGIMVVSILLIGGVCAFVVVPYMWQQSNSTRSLWQSVCRLERENRRLHEHYDGKKRNDKHSPVSKENRNSNDTTPQVNLQPFHHVEMISHGFRSAMNSIMGHSQLLLDSELTPDQEGSAEIIYDSSVRLMSLMNDVLDLSRMSAGKFELSNKPFFVEDVFDQVGMRLGYQARDKNLEMMCFPDPHLHAKLKGDEKSLRQILEVLIQDAIRFTDQGKINLRSKLLKSSERSQTIRFTIEDTGSMLQDEDRRSRLLGNGQEQFQSSVRGDGSGLEIPIIKHLLTLLGSELQIKDRSGGGLCCQFNLELPVALNERRRLSAERHFDNQRILLAEDNDEVASFVESLLTAWGVEVSTTDSLDGILDLIADSEIHKLPYSLVMIDSQLDNMPFSLFNDGILSTCAEHNLHTILLSSRPDGTETAEHDRVSILEKPFTAAQLNTAIYHVLSEAAVSISDKPSKKQDTPEDTNLRMLIVDDDRVSRELASRILTRAGYVTETAENGLEALKKIEEHSYDLVLMDLDMPQMDGFESTQRIRENWTAEELPIIALTANAMNDCADRCYRTGMNDFITKPFQIEKLLLTLSRYKSMNRTKAPAAKQASSISSS